MDGTPSCEKQQRKELSVFKPHRLLALAALALVAALSFTAPAAAQTPSGTIQFGVFKAGFIVGAGGGSGTLFYQGRSYPIDIGGISLGLTIGISKAQLHGEVYNLTNPADIQGTYSAATASVAFVGGGKVATIKNSRGVVLKVRGKQVGLDLNLSLGGLSINLK
jgi:hypothetical protein